MSVVDAVLRLLKKEEERLDKELSGITAAITAFGKTYVSGKNAQRFSARRARIAVVPKARSAKARKTGKVVPIKSKRTLSAAAGKKVTPAQKARSGRVRAAKKSA
ncbi:MAG TPA: hypothetical protein VKB49_15685 [Candidatus Sulfotelmatobacter sp.]|nr:hypothetical protein [Candidatus Sulfotelmatobacter sp.]